MNLHPRVRDVFLLAPIPLILLVLSVPTAWAILTFVGLIGLWEYRVILSNTRKEFYSHPSRIAFGTYLVMMLCALYDFKLGIITWALSVMVVYLSESRRMRADYSIGQVIIPLIVLLAYGLRLIPQSDMFPFGGISLLGLALIITAFSDSGAYFVGKAYGKRKFAPIISPKKTWEGAIGGWFFGVMGGMIYTWMLLPGLADTNPLLLIILFLILSFAGQMGDLCESYFKRRHDVKDSGDALRSHGGVLDRFDSLGLVLPFLAAYLYLGGYV